MLTFQHCFYPEANKHVFRGFVSSACPLVHSLAPLLVHSTTLALLASPFVRSPSVPLHYTSSYPLIVPSTCPPACWSPRSFMLAYAVLLVGSSAHSAHLLIRHPTTLIIPSSSCPTKRLSACSVIHHPASRIVPLCTHPLTTLLFCSSTDSLK